MKPKSNGKIAIEKQWLTIGELAQYLGFGNYDVQQEWRDTAQLPYYQVGKKILYKKADVDRFVERHRMTP